MSWLSKLAFWRDDEPEIVHPEIEQMEGYEVDGCFVPNDATPDTEALSDNPLDGAGLEDAACEIPEVGTTTPRTK